VLISFWRNPKFLANEISSNQNFAEKPSLIYVNMRRFIRFMTIKIKAIGANYTNRWHKTSSFGNDSIGQEKFSAI